MYEQNNFGECMISFLSLFPLRVVFLRVSPSLLISNTKTKFMKWLFGSVLLCIHWDSVPLKKNKKGKEKHEGVFSFHSTKIESGEKQGSSV